MAIVQVKPTTAKIPLGRQGENLARRIQFNISSWQAEFGPGMPALIHKRYGDSVAYPVPIQVEGAGVYWDVTSVDNENPGNGKCELAYYVDDVIVKSATYQTVVQASMNDEVGYEPQDVPNWVDTIHAAVASANAAIENVNVAAKEALDAAEEAREAAEEAGQDDNYITADSIADDAEVDEMLDEIFGDGAARDP